jgi:hypothetical protein
MRATVRFAQHAGALNNTTQIVVELEENTHLSVLLKALVAPVSGG